MAHYLADMKITLVTTAVIILALGFVFLWPGPGDEPAVRPGPEHHRVSREPVTEPVAADTRLADMKAAYRALEQARRELRSRANLMKSKIWGLELPPEQAREVSRKLRQTYAYLKNPPMLGAFQGADAIENETEKVQSLQRDVDEIETLIAGAGNATGRVP